MDWNLRSCARHGHITYRPTEPGLAERLTATTQAGVAWRCLRCGAYVPGDPHGVGPAEEAPLVLRGKALRDAFILRLLSAERGVRGLLILALGLAVLRFKTSQASLRQLFEADLPSLKPLADKLGFDLQNNAVVNLIRHALSTKTSTLKWVTLGLFAYAAILLTESIGLWLLKRWGEYFTVVATAAFIPFEIHEVLKKVTTLRVSALAVNLAAVAYILLTKRLFGLRGGRAAYDDERHSVSLLEVETAAEGA